MIEQDEYTVRMLDLPASVGGFITESPDGYVNIYINARHGDRGQRRAFLHELRHAENDDLHSAEDLAVIEARADGRDPRLRAIPTLLRARDLIPRCSAEMPQRADRAPPSPRLTPRQARVLADGLSELDHWFFNVPFLDGIAAE